MRRYVVVIAGLLFGVLVQAQDDLLAGLEEELDQKEVKVEATFKGTRIINGHSIETRKAGALDFIISHRFGTLDGGFYELFGLDNAQVRFGFEYALTDRLYIGVGRSSFQKTYDGFVKYRLLQQKTGGASTPLSITWVSSIAIKTLRNPTRDLDFTEKLANTHQLLIARKFSSDVSLQLMPTWVHKNLIAATDDNNDIFALGAGGRVKLNQRVSLNVEYYYQFQKLNQNTRDALAIGFDIETGGHVFQLQFTNATAMIPEGFVAETTNNFFDGGIHFGFNISRTFQLK